MFGGAAPAPPTPPAATGRPPTTAEAHDSEMLAPLDRGELAKTVEEMNNKLTIGGLLYMRAQWDTYQDSVLRKAPFQMPNYTDLYLDWRPSDDLRAFVRGRLIYNPAGTGGATNQLTAFGTLGQASCTELCPYLDQFWLKWNIAHKIFFTLGRQHVKWGTGNVWNPTDFLNPLKFNPFDVYDQRLGVNMLRIHIPVESKAWNFYGIVTADGVSSLSQIGYAARAEFAVGPTEMTASAAYQENQPLKLGADISAGVGDFDLHAEAAVIHPIAPNQMVLYSGRFPTQSDLDTLTTEINAGEFAQAKATFPSYHTVDLVHEWIPQIVAGLDYTLKYSDQDSINIGAEYFYNNAGYSNSNLYPVLFLALAQNLPGAYTPLYTGKHYGSVYLTVPNPGNWNQTTFAANWIANLSDNSHVVRVDWRQTVLTWMTTDLYASYFFGADGEFHYSTSLSVPSSLASDLKAYPNAIPPPFNSVAAGLAGSPFSIPAHTWEIGAGMIVTM
jgi:hypothetical protein